MSKEHYDDSWFGKGEDNFIHQDMNYKSKIYVGSKNNVIPSQIWSFCWKNKDHVCWVALLGFQISKIKKRMREVREQIQEFSVIWTVETRGMGKLAIY